MNTSNHPVHTICVHPSEVWGPNWQQAEELLNAWGEYISNMETPYWNMNSRTPPFNSAVEKARRHPNPKYRK